MAVSSDTKMEWLIKAGITEAMLLEIVANGSTTLPKCIPLTAPTYGILIELYHFSHTVADTLKRRPNRVLKLLVDFLFPFCAVSRADRLERRVQNMHRSLESLSKEQIPDFLCTQWMPKATGVYLNIIYFAII